MTGLNELYESLVFDVYYDLVAVRIDLLTRNNSPSSWKVSMVHFDKRLVERSQRSADLFTCVLRKHQLELQKQQYNAIVRHSNAGTPYLIWQEHHA